MLFTRHIAVQSRETYRWDALATTTWAMALLAMSSLGMVVARRAHAGAWIFSASIAMGYVPGLLAGIIPVLAQRFPVGTILPALRMLAGIALALCIPFPSLTMLIVALLTMVLMGGLSDATYPALFRELYPLETHARILGLLFTERTLAAFGVFLLLGWVLNDLPPTTCIRVLGVLGVLAMMAAGFGWRFRGVRTTPETPDPQAAAPAHPLADRRFIRYLIALTLWGSGSLVALVIWPIVQVNAFGLSNGQVGVLAAVGTLAQMGTFLYFSRFGVVKARNRLLALPYALYAATMTASILLYLFRAGGVFPFWALLFGTSIANIGMGLQQVYFYLVVNEMAGAAALRYQAVQYNIIGVRGVIVPFIAGALYTHGGLLPAMLTALTLTLAGAVAAWWPESRRT